MDAKAAHTIELQTLLDELTERYRCQPEGAIPGYIPLLQQSDPNHFALSITLADGRQFSSGDDRAPFSLQSIGKVFSYAKFLEIFGRRRASELFEMAASPFAFNSLELSSRGRPFNPMINTGALTIWAHLLAGPNPMDSSSLINEISQLAGENVAFSPEDVETSFAVGFRNKEIATQLGHKGVLPAGVDTAAILRAYYELCFVLMNTRSLSKTMSELAKTKIANDLAHGLLEFGLYEESTLWSETVGWPAKSSVSGVVLAFIPGKMSIAIYAPGLNNTGNSPRALQALEKLVAITRAEA